MSYELNFRPAPFQGQYELDEWEAFDSEFDQEGDQRSSWTPLMKAQDIYSGQSLVPELTDKNFWNIFLDRNKVVVVDFWQQWCRPCDPVAKIMVDLAKRYRSSPFKGRVKFYHVQLEDNLNPKLYQSFPFDSVPTVFFYYTASGRRPTRLAPLLEGSMQGTNGFDLPKVHDPEAYIHRIDTILRRHSHLKPSSRSLARGSQLQQKSSSAQAEFQQETWLFKATDLGGTKVNLSHCDLLFLKFCRARNNLRIRTDKRRNIESDLQREETNFNNRRCANWPSKKQPANVKKICEAQAKKIKELQEAVSQAEQDRLNARDILWQWREKIINECGQDPVERLKPGPGSVAGVRC